MSKDVKSGSQWLLFSINGKGNRNQILQKLVCHKINDEIGEIILGKQLTTETPQSNQCCQVSLIGSQKY